MKQKFYTVKEAADYKSVSEQSIRNALWAKKFPNAVKEPKHEQRGTWYIPQSDLDNWQPRDYPKTLNN